MIGWARLEMVLISMTAWKEVMITAVPHTHLGEIELCYDTLCARLTTTEEVANVLGGLFVVGACLVGLASLARALSR